MNNIAVIGSTGAIGRAMVSQLQQEYPNARLNVISKAGLKVINPLVVDHKMDIFDEQSIEAAASRIVEPLDLVIIATGFLQNEQIKPEKSLRDISAANFQYLFQINTIGPALVAKYFLPKLNRQSRSVFAALSARVGSIEDNQLGGWYAYRASKAALNMVIKNASIEIARKNKHAIVVSLHPGTVASKLSKPFQGNVPEEQLFSPEFAASKLLSVVKNLNIDQTGRMIAWDGTTIPF